MSQFCFTFHHFGYSYPSINKTSIKYQLTDFHSMTPFMWNFSFAWDIEVKQYIVYNNQNGHVIYLLKMIKLYNEQTNL